MILTSDDLTSWLLPIDSMPGLATGPQVLGRRMACQLLQVWVWMSWAFVICTLLTAVSWSCCIRSDSAKLA